MLFELSKQIQQIQQLGKTNA